MCSAESTITDFTQAPWSVFVFPYALARHKLHSLQLVQKAETGVGRSWEQFQLVENVSSGHPS